MKILKIIGIILLVIVLAVVVFVLTLKGEGHMERSITINAPVEKVFMVVSNFEYNKDWSPWYKLDPDTKYEYTENKSGVGAKYSWDSEDPNVMTGEQEIIEVKENELVNTRMAFGDMTGTYYASFILKPNEDSTTELTWTYDGKADAMGEKFFIDYLAESFLGSQYEQGLTDLKTFIEGMPDPEPEIIEVDSTAVEDEMIQ